MVVGDLATRFIPCPTSCLRHPPLFLHYFPFPLVVIPYRPASLEAAARTAPSNVIANEDTTITIAANGESGLFVSLNHKGSDWLVGWITCMVWIDICHAHTLPQLCVFRR